MAINVKMTERYVRLLRQRGPALASQGQTVAALLATAPVDLQGVLGPVLLIAQGVARANATVLAYIMSDAAFSTQRLGFQGDVSSQATLWNDLWVALANMAFSNRLPAIEALVASSPGAALFGANSRGVSISTSLESIVNTAAVAGIVFSTFWNSTSTGRTSLGRLLAIDPVLSRTYDFDVLSEAMLSATELIPVAPDPIALIRQIEKARPVRIVEHVSSSAISRMVAQGMDLAALAQDVLGDADQWRLIAAFNDLRYPYISDEPIAQFGDAQGTVLLATPTTAGAKTVTLVDASRLYLDQRLYFSDGLNAEIAAISSVDKNANVVTLSTPISRVYAVTSIVTVYQASYEVTGKVLRSGDMLVVPIAGPSNDAHTIMDPNVRISPERLYGKDIAVDDQGKLVVGHGDLTIATGTDNLLQALRHRYRTTKGSLPHHPDYGFGVEPYLGYKHTAFFDFLAIVEATQTALNDPRIESVRDFKAVSSGDAIDMEFTVITKNKDVFPAVQISAPVRG